MSALNEPRLERAIGVIYRPETERQSHYFHARLANQFDALLHFDQTRAVEPLERPWPPKAIVRVISVVEPVPSPAAELWYDASGSLQRVQQEMTKRATELTQKTSESLKRKGLKIESAVREGDARSVIVDGARKWSADLIVLGSHGYTGIKRLLLGSVALSLVSHAPLFG